ncbi:hypothetical protein C455_01522 [Haloferax larsenii JCM 13917]|nr:hypothetical protein [Haloferax larsenii]ELZ84341.1 hypothetical protein C455_01522 [Haloferax larsenii JCM 13917]
MVGGTLRDIRAEVRSLSRPDGDYMVVCGKLGTEPSVVSGLRFPDRDAASEAADLAKKYRAALRRYDPAVPYYDPLVHEESNGPVASRVTDSVDERTRYISFCHDVTGSVFEALSETGTRSVESAAMETYLTLAEVVSDEDDFCLTMLWSMMSEMDVRLSVSEQTTVVETAAERFASAPMSNPVEATLRNLESASFIEGYSLRSVTHESETADSQTTASAADESESDSTDTTQSTSWELTFGDYALAERTGRLPTLPIAVDLLRRTPGQSVRFFDGEALSDSRWRLRLQTGTHCESAGLVSVDAVENRWLNDSAAPLRSERPGQSD